MTKNKKSKIKTEVMILNKLEIKPVYSKIAKKYNVDYRTVKKAYEGGYETKPERKKRISKLDDYKEEIILKLSINRSSMRAVHNYLVSKHGLDKIGAYSTFKHYVKTHDLKKETRRILGGYCAYECKEGELAQCDWKEDIILHDRSGKEYTINIFHLVLKYSKYSYIEMTLSREQPVVFRCLINAFEFFGGVTEKVMFDNMTTVVDVNANPVRVNVKMQQFAKDFNFEVVKCKPRSPQTKGTNEARNKLLDWVRPYDNEFDDVSDLLRIVDDINYKMNRYVCAGTGLPPLTLFIKEKEYLNPLPQNDLTSYYCKAEAIVNDQQLIYYKGSMYSVDKSYIGETLKVDECSDMLLLYYKSSLIEIHHIKNNKYNYKNAHYAQTTIKLANHGDFEQIAQKNLELLDKFTANRTFTISLDQALESNDKMMAFLLQSIKNKTYLIEYLAAKKQNERKEFLNELRDLFADTADVIAMLNWLDGALKNAKSNIFTMLFFDYSEGVCQDFLNKEGFTKLYEKHKEEINYYKETEKQDAHTKRTT